MHWRRQLHLPLTLVVVAPHADMNALSHVSKAAQNSAFFWGLLDIRLKPVVVGLETPLEPTGPFFDDLSKLHYWEVRPNNLVVYIWPSAARVGRNAENLGQAFAEFAIAAGDVLVPGGESMLDEIIDHEIGHLLGLAHEPGTFMGVPLELHNRHVTHRQVGVMREAVKRL